MSKIKRYTLMYLTGNNDARMVNTKDGEYVKYDDIKHLLNTSSNSDYAKCLDSVKKELYGNNPERIYSREEVFDIIRKHFA